MSAIDQPLLFRRLLSIICFLHAVYQTEVRPKTLDPTWNTFTTSLQNLANGDPGRVLKVQCFDYDKNSEPDFMGEIEVTVKV